MVKHDSLIEMLQQLGFTQYEAQCYLGLLRQHPLNGSQLSTLCGVPRSMVYQTLGRLEEKEAVVRVSSKPGEPQQYEPVAPRLVIAHLSAQFQATCEQAEADLDTFVETPPAEVVFNIVGTDSILQHVALLVRQARQRLSLMGGSPELAALEPDLQAAVARGVAARIVSIGPAPAVEGQVVAFMGENVSAPTRFLVIIADSTPVLMATFPPNAGASAVLTENPILARLFSAFLNTEYYLARLSNQNPELVGEMLSQVLEPEDRERYTHILRFLDQQGRAGRPGTNEREKHA
ncbi:MAG TPA: helix-turn-helix domain-containing protein [Ktedonobacteraceae bacterium]|jgi:sugar-specific transcriptional regulator TrmB|nr:helix-turn-helix domain-containing protein [Ktedonobacteraceae bacterium]